VELGSDHPYEFFVALTRRTRPNRRDAIHSGEDKPLDTTLAENFRPDRDCRSSSQDYAINT
jgi:hypothetical protein